MFFLTRAAPFVDLRTTAPARARGRLEGRPVPGEDAAALRRAVQERIDRACATRDGVTARLDWPDALPPFDQPAADRLVEWSSRRTGRDPGVVAFYTEAELYRGSLAVPTVVCGPGGIEQAHTVDESIGFDELEEGAAFYADALDAFCG